LVSHTNSLYGAGRSLLELVRCLLREGLDVGVALPAGGLLGHKLLEHRCTVWNRALPSWVHQSGSQSPGLSAAVFDAAAADLQPCLADWGADLLWTNSTITPVGALMAEHMGIPHVWHLRELNGPPHAFEFCLGTDEAVRLIRAASRRVAVSRTVKKYYEGLGCGESEWVYNGIDSAARLAARQRRRAQTVGPDRLLIVGRIAPVKEQRIAIEATSRLHRAGYAVKLRVVGGGDVESCRRHANALGIGSRVEFTGFSQCPERHYRWADIALSCCRIEAMGRSTAEAMSWGLPIAGHDAAGTGELVGDAGGGLLYRGGGEELAEVIAALIDDRAAAAAKGASGQQWARRHVSNERHAQRIREIVVSLAEPDFDTGIRARPAVQLAFSAV
jgi:glycosyltransferase involved in cell wall biosynthesis